MGSNADERLAHRAARGDRSALEEIFRRYHQDLYRYCLAIVRNPDDAQEAVQNTMVKMVRALPGEEREIKLKPWLYRIARNEAVETLRRRRDSVELSQEQEGSTAEIAETADSRERLRALLDDLEQLPERQRSGLVMRELAGLGFEEIGAAFETSPAVARQTVYEARLSLRQMEAGREMSCTEIKRELSDADGRVTRRREIRAHLRDCPDCRAFEQAIVERREDFAAIAVLPAAASAAMLGGALGGGAGAGAGAAAGSAGAGGIGKVLAGSAVAKSVATAAVIATVGVGVADRSGVVDLPLTGGDEKSTVPAGAQATDDSSGGDSRTNYSEGAEGGSESDGGENGGAAGNERTNSNSTAAVEREPTNRPAATDAPPGAAPTNQAGGNGNDGEPGRSTLLPGAAAAGQQTAAANKSPQGNRSPGTPRRNPSPGTPRGNPSPGTPRSNAAGKGQKSKPASPAQEKTSTPPGDLSPPAPKGQGSSKAGHTDEP